MNLQPNIWSCQRIQKKCEYLFVFLSFFPSAEVTSWVGKKCGTTYESFT